LPLPDAPDTIVSQLELSLAVQAQPAPAVTWMNPVVASEPTMLPVGEISKVQGAGVGGVGVGFGAGGVGVGPGTGVCSGSAAAC
jgi:hypothetical protein